MYAEISSAFTSINALSTLLKSAQSLANYNEIVAAVSEVNSKLISAQTGALAGLEKQQAQVGRISELEKEIAGLKAWEAKAQRYELASFATDIFAYRLKEAMRNGEPAHWACSRCFQESKIGFLNLKYEVNGNKTFECVNCKKEFRIRGQSY